MINKKVIAAVMCVAAVSAVTAPQKVFAFTNDEVVEYLGGGSISYYTDSSGLAWFYQVEDNGNVAIIGAAKGISYMEVPSVIDGKTVDTVYGIVYTSRVCKNEDVKEVSKVKIPASVTTLDKSAFSNLVGVKEVEMPEKLNDGTLNLSRSPGVSVNGKDDKGKDVNYTQFDAKNAGWNVFDGNKYYFDSEKGYLSGWQVIDGKQYYFYSNGQMATAFIDLAGTKYYLDPTDGTLKFGWQKINNKWYYFSPSAEGTKVKGFMKTSWLYNNGNWYYFYSDGTMATGFINLNGAYYYLDESSTSSVGIMKTGWQKIQGSWYYFNRSSDSGIEGMMNKGWNKINGKWYYFYYGDGKMAAGTWIDGYYVNRDGAWVQ